MKAKAVSRRRQQYL